MTNRTPAISVVLDCDVGPIDRLRESLASVLRWPRPELELLLVGSQAHRPDLATVVDGDPRVRRIEAPAGGPDDGIVAALRHADGDMIGLLTPHDLLLPDHLERMTANLAEAGVDVVVSRPAWVTRAGMVVPLPRPWWSGPVATASSWVVEAVPAGAVMCRRSIVLLDPPSESIGSTKPLTMTERLGVRPETAVRWLDDVTCLRFQAPTAAGSQAQEAAPSAWLDVLVEAGSWPAALRLDMAGDGSPRQVLEQASPAWVAAMRAAVPDAFERIAWDRLDDISREALDRRVIEALQERVRQLEQERSGWSRDVTGVRQALTAARKPAVEPLPAIRRSFRAAGPARRARRAVSIVRSAVMAKVWNPLFDARWYREHYPDVPGGPRTWIHWRRHGWREARDPNRWFDTSWYLEQNPDVADSGADPLEHYLRWGWREGREPSARFDARAYRSHHPDVDAAGVDPLLHRLRHGGAEGGGFEPGTGPRQTRG